MGFFKDIRDVSKQGKELGDYHGGMPTWKQGMATFRAVADDRGEKEVLQRGTPATAVVKGFPSPVPGDNLAMQIPLEVHPQDGAPYQVDYVFPSTRMKAALSIGMEVPIKIHPDDRQRVAVQWDAQQAAIAAAGGDMAAVMKGFEANYGATPGGVAASPDAAFRQATGMPAAGSATPGPAAGGGGDVSERLSQLNDLRLKGLITEDEFEAKKADILGTL